MIRLTCLAPRDRSARALPDSIYVHAAGCRRSRSPAASRGCQPVGGRLINIAGVEPGDDHLFDAGGTQPFQLCRGQPFPLRAAVGKVGRMARIAPSASSVGTVQPSRMLRMPPAAGLHVNHLGKDRDRDLGRGFRPDIQSAGPWSGQDRLQRIRLGKPLALAAWVRREQAADVEGIAPSASTSPGSSILGSWVSVTTAVSSGLSPSMPRQPGGQARTSWELFRGGEHLARIDDGDVIACLARHRCRNWGYEPCRQQRPRGGTRLRMKLASSSDKKECSPSSAFAASCAVSASNSSVDDRATRYRWQGQTELRAAVRQRPPGSPEPRSRRRMTPNFPSARIRHPEIDPLSDAACKGPARHRSPPPRHSRRRPIPRPPCRSTTIMLPTGRGRPRSV